jgi:hypothetical protein
MLSAMYRPTSEVSRELQATGADEVAAHADAAAVAEEKPFASLSGQTHRPTRELAARGSSASAAASRRTPKHQKLAPCGELGHARAVPDIGDYVTTG